MSVSKVFEKLFLQKLMLVIAEKRLIPAYQFGFRSKHVTVKQIHRITNKITLAFEARKYYSAMFLDVSQAFDKVWHDGLLSIEYFEYSILTKDIFSLNNML